MPVQGTTCMPLSRAIRSMKRTSRPPNMAVGSTIVFTPTPFAPLAASSPAS